VKHPAVFHPFLFAIYSILGVFSQNSVQIPVQWVARPLIMSLALVSVLYLILRKKTGDAQYAGLVTTLGLFWFFFGHFHRELFNELPFWGTTLGTLLAFVMWTAPLVFLGSAWAWKRISNRGLITNVLNLTSVIVVLYPAFITGQTVRQTILYENSLSLNVPVALEKSPTQPDIYLIILDAYGRDDFLRDVYGFDNSEFIGYLKQKGFYVADLGSSNYPQTLLSLSSLLNMDYLDELTKDIRDTDVRGPVVNLVQQSSVRRSLKSVGYDFVALPSATLSTQMRDADIYIEMTIGDINEFEGLLLSSTVANLAIDAWDLNIPVPSYDLHRRYILFSFEKLASMPEVDGPKFVFSHIMAPHPPFVFDELGNPIQPARPFNTGDASGFMGTSEEYIAGYTDEIHFLNRRLIQVIDILLEQSNPPPVIIIQGDHGPGNYFNMIEPKNDCLKERYSILNAYYFPDQNYEALYPTITPVNSFRIVFSQYFGTNIGLLEDRNYYASWLAPYVFNEVSDQIGSCGIGSN
jgi:hypothetical protein